MGGKKKQAAAAGSGAKAGGDEEDVTFHNFFKYYKRNCQMAGIEMNKRVRRAYEEDYLIENKMLTSVSLIIFWAPPFAPLDPFVGRDRLARVPRND